MDGEELVLNGRKWWTSGAMDPRCEVCLFLGVTDPLSSPHRRHSIVIVPMKTKGIKIVRPLEIYGYDDAPHGHAEVIFENVRIPAGDAFLLGQGK